MPHLRRRCRRELSRSRSILHGTKIGCHSFAMLVERMGQASGYAVMGFSQLTIHGMPKRSVAIPKR
jgi:hypothetical protein